MSHPGSPYHENEACANFASDRGRKFHEAARGAKFAPGERVDLIAATRAGRAAIARALGCPARGSELRVLLYVVVDLVSWSRMSNKVPLAQVAAATKLHPHTVGRCLKAWHDRGVLRYEPARREGEYGTVSLEPCNEAVELIAERDRAPRVEMRDVWVGMRDVTLRGIHGGPAQLRVLLVLIAQAACWSRVELRASQSELAAAAGCSQAQVRRAISWLAAHDVIRYAPGTGHSCSRIRFGREDVAELSYQPRAAAGADERAREAGGVDNHVEPPSGARPGCRLGARPRTDREHVVTPPSDSETRSTLDVEGFIEELRDRLGLVVEQRALSTELQRLHQWGREELLAAVLARPLPTTLHSPSALMRSRLSELAESPPSVMLRQQRAAEAAARATKERDLRERAEAEQAALAPYLERVDAMSREVLEDVVRDLGGGVLALWQRGRSPAMLRAVLADELRNRAQLVGDGRACMVGSVTV